MDKPDTITVVVSHREEIRAEKADIYLSVKAISLITGDVAMKKVKELAQVISHLNLVGIKEENIALRGVHAERNSPIIGPLNPAIYMLRVHCNDLRDLPELLACITAQRNVILDEMEWHFAEDADVQTRWLDKCLSEARAKAERIAAGLGVRLLGIHTYFEKWLDPGDDQKRVVFSSARAAPVKDGNDRNAELAFPLVITKQIELNVEVHFRVSAYQ